MWLVIQTMLNIFAIVIGILLSWLYFTNGAIPGCGTGSSCDQVLSSRWTSLAGIVPVSGLALGAYLAIFVASLNIRPAIETSIRNLSWNVLLILAGAIIGSAIWFTILQKWILKSFCIYCMTAHITGVLLSASIIWRSTREYETAQKEKLLIKPFRIIVLIFAGMLASGIVAVLQFNDSPIATHQKNDRLNFQHKMDIENAPIIGSPDAAYKVTLLFDYQCSHCQKIHFMLNSVVQQYKGKLAFVLMTSPLENSCNPHISPEKTTFKNSCELSKIGLAVWLANPSVFPEFENWMFTFDTGSTWKPKSIEAAKAKATELLGSEMLETALADRWVSQYLHYGVQLFGQTLQNGKGAIPKMIYNESWIIPEPYNADDLMTILNKSLRVPKP